MSEQAMMLLQKLLAARIDATGAHCVNDPPPDEGESQDDPCLG